MLFRSLFRIGRGQGDILAVGIADPFAVNISGCNILELLLWLPGQENSPLPVVARERKLAQYHEMWYYGFAFNSFHFLAEVGMIVSGSPQPEAIFLLYSL